MNKGVFAACIVVACNAFVSANAQVSCDAALKPNVEQSSSSNVAIYSYMAVHAADEYEALRNSSGSESGASFFFKDLFKAFGAEAKTSENKQDFVDKVRKKLDEVGYILLRAAI